MPFLDQNMFSGRGGEKEGRKERSQKGRKKRCRGGKQDSMGELSQRKINIKVKHRAGKKI